MINEHELFIITMSFLAAYFAVLLMIVTASFISYHRDLHRHVQMYLIKGREKDQDDEDGDPR